MANGARWSTARGNFLQRRNSFLIGPAVADEQVQVRTIALQLICAQSASAARPADTETATVADDGSAPAIYAGQLTRA